MNNSNNRDNYNSDNDFLNDAGFINFHFKLNARDEFWWQNWIAKHPEKAESINNARGVLNMLSFTLPDDEYNTELQKIKSAIGKMPHAKQPRGLSRLVQWTSGRTRAQKIMAAAILVFVISGIYIVRHFVSDNNELKEHVNNTAKNIVFSLDDNSRVTLTPGSSLHYNEFNSNERTVHLQGDGRFEVTKSLNAPFKVYTGNLVATVLGTTFEISSSSYDSSITVDLNTGSLKVGISTNKGIISQEMILEPGQRAVFSNHQLVMSTQSLQSDAGLRRHVTFSKNDFLQIAEIISKTYGIVLINESGSNNWKFSGQFKNSTAHDIIESICLIKGLTSTIKGDTIIIR